MKALLCKQYGPPEKLRLETAEDPVPGKGAVLVDVKAAGINFPDLLLITGDYQVKVPPPFIPGSEASGVVAAVGDGVERFKPGDRVIVTPTIGAFAERCVVDQKFCLPLPAGMSFEQGAGFTITYATAYHAFRQSKQLRPGDTVLVLGAAGGVGVAAVEIAKALGARVIAAASSQAKLDFARAAGADLTINYTEQPLRETVKELTGGRGVDVVYDPVGGPLAEEAFRALAWQGRYLVIGFASGDIPRFALNIALLKEARVVGVWWGTWAKHEPDEALQNMVELFALVDQGKLEPRVTERYPLARYAEAFAVLTERRARGKVVLTMD
ncbi:MAG: NADPH:quinone oxidoreductase family protein [Xanthomonadales bacterium]|nr:NADPH:quinone oxidoreductase family protein [Xanthomonadales bacterium]